MLDRREFAKSALALGLGALTSSAVRDASGAESTTNAASGSKPIVIHHTDLFHPHGDPDDHFDLAALFALSKSDAIDLRGVVLDYPPEFRKGDPAVVAVAQMNRMTRRAVPAVVGAEVKVSKRDDKLEDMSPEDSAGIDFLLDQLERAESPVHVLVVGSASDVAVASSRRPELFREKCAGVYLDAGSAFQSPKDPNLLEYNVQLNPSAYATLFDLPCPLYWYPCWHEMGQYGLGEYGTYFVMEHARAFEGVSNAVAGFFTYMFEQSSDPHWLGAIKKPVDAAAWAKVLSGKRNMWSTASVLATANKTILRDGSIVERTPEVDASPDALYRMENIRATCDDAGRVTWELCEEETNRKIFHILDVEQYTEATTRAINTLFRTL